MDIWDKYIRSPEDGYGDYAHPAACDCGSRRCHSYDGPTEDQQEEPARWPGGFDEPSYGGES